jgi:hypothetical protein
MDFLIKFTLSSKENIVFLFSDKAIAIITSSKILLLLFIMSRCPTVIGSKLPE